MAATRFAVCVFNWMEAIMMMITTTTTAEPNKNKFPVYLWICALRRRLKRLFLLLLPARILLQLQLRRRRFVVSIARCSHFGSVLFHSIFSYRKQAKPRRQLARCVHWRRYGVANRPSHLLQTCRLWSSCKKL